MKGDGSGHARLGLGSLLKWQPFYSWSGDATQGDVGNIPDHIIASLYREFRIDVK